MASVLLVDDDPRIVRAIVPALGVSGLHVTVAVNGVEAMHLVDTGNWDILVVDLGLPDIGGRAIISHLRDRSGTPVIVISAQHSRVEVDAAYWAGADQFLHKPFRTVDLVRCIGELVGR